MTLSTYLKSIYAQKSSEIEMNNIDYQHKSPPSFLSKLKQSIMGLFGMKKKMERKMITNSFEKEPEKPSKSLLKSYNIEENEQKGSKVWTISSKANKSDVVLLILCKKKLSGLLKILRNIYEFIFYTPIKVTG